MKEKLLLLGISNDTRFVIEYAKKQGYHTILCDYTPIEKNPLKRLTDEHWEIDITDTDALEKKCREENVKGVFAGNNEFCLDQVKLLTARLGLPFYASEEGWLCTRDKGRLKEHCIAVGLDVPQRYNITPPFTDEVLSSLKFPLMVKPADSCASRGVTICRAKEELESAYQCALQFSPSKNIIIEDFIDGEEMGFTFFVSNGEYRLISLGSYAMIEYNGKKVLGVGYNGHRHVDIFVEKYSDKVAALLKHMDIKQGPVSIQCFFSNDKFYIFEIGYRLDGCCGWMLVEQSSGVNLMHQLVDYAMGRECYVDWDSVQKKGLWDNFGVSFLMWTNPGKVAAVEGLDEVNKMDGVAVVMQRFFPGMEIGAGGSWLQIAFMVNVWGDTVDEVIEKLKKISATLKLVSENGENLLVPFTNYDSLRD